MMAAVVVLDRVNPGVTPPYCTHGQATCVACGKWCWLGNKSYEAVARGGVEPLCKPCADTHLNPAVAVPLGNINDHLRADGPHP